MTTPTPALLRERMTAAIAKEMNEPPYVYSEGFLNRAVDAALAAIGEQWQPIETAPDALGILGPHHFHNHERWPSRPVTVPWERTSNPSIVLWWDAEEGCTTHWREILPPPPGDR